MMVELIDVDGMCIMGVKLELVHAPVLLRSRQRTSWAMLWQSSLAVRTFEDMLNARIVSASEKAQETGITAGMNGKDAVKLLA